MTPTELPSQPEAIADLPCRVGDAPLWHPAERRLYWSDVPAGRLYRYDPAAGTHEPCYEGRPVGGMTLQADGALLLFRDQGNIVLWRQGEIVETIVNGIAELRATRFTEAAADPEGRAICGTLSDARHPGRLYRLGLNGQLTLLSDACGTPAGLGFTPDGRGLYFNDCHATRRTTWLFDYARDEGRIANRRCFRDDGLADDAGAPAGLAVDAGGDVWTARWNGAAVWRLDAASGAVAARVALPVRKATALCFGGEDLEDLYITTAGGHLRQADGARAGALFRVRDLAVRGLPRHVTRLGQGKQTA
jgi:D-xylonolactonase